MQTPIIAVAALGMALAGPVHAQQQHRGPAPQQQALKRKILQTFDVPGGAYETLIGTSELGPNKSAGRQSHPGPEGGYVLQGDGTMLVDGQPPIRLKAGQSYKLAPRAVHELRSGVRGVKLIITWVVKKGEPFASMAN